MPQLDTQTLALRSAAAWQIRDQWKASLQDAYEMALAARNPYDESKNPRSLSRQYDSTAPNSVIRAANRLLMELTPPDQKWPDVVPGPLLELQLQKEVLAQLKQQLAPVNKMLGLAFLSDTFINSQWEVYLDLLVAGLGAMLVLENGDDYGDPAIFQSVSQSEIAIEENGKGGIGGIYRKRKKFKVRNIKDLWSDAEIPKEMQDLLDKKSGKGKNADPEVDLLECTYEGPRGSNVAWYYDVLWQNGGDPVRIVKREYTTCPWIIYRWSKLPGIPYGPGPVLMMLADIRTLNKVKEMLLKNAALALAGIYLARDDGVLNPDNVLLTPGGIIPVSATGGSVGASLAPLQTGRDFNLVELVINDLQASIKKGLFDNALPPAESTVRSPTEIMQRVKELTQDIGGNIGRLTAALVQLVRRVMDIYFRKGLIPKIHVDQYTMRVQINSPLARTQQMNEVQTVVDWLEMVKGIGGPQAVMLAAKAEAINVWVAEKMGVPSELYNSEDEQAALQKKLAVVAAAQAAGGLPGQAAGVSGVQA